MGEREKSTSEARCQCPKTKAVGYVRVSTATQAGEDTFGREAQEDAIREFAAKHGYELVGVYDEVGSGAHEREVLDGLAYGAELMAPDVKAVIVYKNDRIARDTKLYFYYQFLFEKRGVKLVSINERFADIPDEIVPIYTALMQFVAEQERKNINMRTMAGKREKAKRGGFVGGVVPFGYKSIDHALIVDDVEARVVRKIFERHEAGESMNAMCDWLTDNGYRTRTGSPWAAATILGILRRRRLYEGYTRFNSDEWIKGTHEAILKEGQ